MEGNLHGCAPMHPIQAVAVVSGLNRMNGGTPMQVRKRQIGQIAVWRVLAACAFSVRTELGFDNGSIGLAEQRTEALSGGLAEFRGLRIILV